MGNRDRSHFKLLDGTLWPQTVYAHQEQEVKVHRMKSANIMRRDTSLDTLLGMHRSNRQSRPLALVRQPLALSLSTLHHALNGVIGHELWRYDRNISPSPWLSNIYGEFFAKDPTIRPFLGDGLVRPYPSIMRRLQEAASAIRVGSCGHSLTSLHVVMQMGES